jgi:hypothetical protein
MTVQQTDGMDSSYDCSTPTRLLYQTSSKKPGDIQMYDKGGGIWNAKVILLRMELGEVDLNHVPAAGIASSTALGSRNLNMNFIRLT